MLRSMAETGSTINCEPPLTDEELGDFRAWREERNKPRSIIIGMSGASGAQYGIRFLEVLSKRPGLETHLVASDNTRLITRYEMGLTDQQHEDIMNLATRRYGYHQMEAAISSGSFKSEGMIVAPCSVKALEQIAHANDENLLTRAAFCTLKEKRTLVLVPREPSVTKAYLENCLRAMDNGAIIVCPEPAFYNGPMSVDDIINQTVQRVLDKFGIEASLFHRWKTPQEEE